jgi:hypothetical protein
MKLHQGVVATATFSVGLGVLAIVPTFSFLGRTPYVVLYLASEMSLHE